MRAKLKNNLLFCLVTILPVVSFAGSVTGTFAWYAFNSRVRTKYSGTSVMANKQLQIGIETDVDLTGFGLTTTDGIAWAAPGATLTSECISYYLNEIGHASTSLYPITSRRYNENDTLQLYREIDNETIVNPQVAGIDKYVQVPLTFRVIDLSQDLPVGNREIWVTQTYLSGDRYNVEKGVRIHFDNGSKKFIYNPSELEDAGYTAVAGCLNLDNDPYYDYDPVSRKEVLYGDLEADSPTPTYVLQSGDSELDDINHTGETNPTNFLAKHKDGSFKIGNFNNLKLGKAYYESRKSIGPDYDGGTGYYSGGKPVCITDDDENAIGRTTMTVWLEGWDHSVVDRVIDLSFTLEVTFQCNQI